MFAGGGLLSCRSNDSANLSPIIEDSNNFNQIIQRFFCHPNTSSPPQITQKNTNAAPNSKEAGSRLPNEREHSRLAQWRVPTHTPLQPMAKQAARPRPSKMPPAPTWTGTGTADRSDAKKNTRCGRGSRFARSARTEFSLSKSTLEFGGGSYRNQLLYTPRNNHGSGTGRPLEDHELLSKYKVGLLSFHFLV